MPIHYSELGKMHEENKVRLNVLADNKDQEIERHYYYRFYDRFCAEMYKTEDTRG